MGYTAFKKKKWLISTSSVAACESGDTITFHGPSTAVIVKCRDASGNIRTSYDPGKYVESTNKIKKTNEYEISMTEGSPGPPPSKSTITFTSTRQSGHLGARDTGSWTADDNGPWPGDDEV